MVGLFEVVVCDKGLVFDMYFEKIVGWYLLLWVGVCYSVYKVLVENGIGYIFGVYLIGFGVEE